MRKVKKVVKMMRVNGSMLKDMRKLMKTEFPAYTNCTATNPDMIPKSSIDFLFLFLFLQTEITEENFVYAFLKLPFLFFHGFSLCLFLKSLRFPINFCSYFLRFFLAVLFVFFPTVKDVRFPCLY